MTFEEIYDELTKDAKDAQNLEHRLALELLRDFTKPLQKMLTENKLTPPQAIHIATAAMAGTVFLCLSQSVKPGREKVAALDIATQFYKHLIQPFHLKGKDNADKGESEG